MQTRDNSITCSTKRGLFGGASSPPRRATASRTPPGSPPGTTPCGKISDKIGGFPGGGWNDVFNIPMTAHFLGGAPIGDAPDTGVIDPYHRVYGHPGLHVVDGAAVSANLGVNPSLTITAQAERAMSLWPNHGDADPRPPLGSAYVRLAPVPPRSPAVPPGAVGRAPPDDPLAARAIRPRGRDRRRRSGPAGPPARGRPSSRMRPSITPSIASSWPRARRSRSVPEMRSTRSAVAVVLVDDGARGLLSDTSTSRWTSSPSMHLEGDGEVADHRWIDARPQRVEDRPGQLPGAARADEEGLELLVGLADHLAGEGCGRSGGVRRLAVGVGVERVVRPRRARRCLRSAISWRTRGSSSMSAAARSTSARSTSASSTGGA